MWINIYENDGKKKISDEIRVRIYTKYLIKCDVFQRDEFTCQNKYCECPGSPLTMHHVKWQKNGGKDSVRNCVTLCRTCHKGFHRGKYNVTMKDNPKLPSHIRGHTFAYELNNEIDWKQIRAEMKALRKTLKDKHNFKITWEQLHILMGFLKLDYCEFDD